MRSVECHSSSISSLLTNCGGVSTATYPMTSLQLHLTVAVDNTDVTHRSSSNHLSGSVDTATRQHHYVARVKHRTEKVTKFGT